MDLASVLNTNPESNNTKRPPPTPSQYSPSKQSFSQAYLDSQRHEAPLHSYSAARERERPPQPPPLRTSHPGSPGNNAAPYNATQSPYQHTSASTSTLSGGPGSYHSQSPAHGTQSQPQGARDAHATQQQPPYNHFVPSPSPYTAANAPLPPTTPGGHPIYMPHQRSQSSQSNPAPSSAFPQPYPPRESPGAVGGPPPSQQVYFSPQGHHTSQPVTPLGPPGPHQGPSPNRPPSSGYDHYGAYSGRSSGSQGGLEYPQRPVVSPQQRRESIQRQYSYERDRERSESVSPKTVPQLGPTQTASVVSPSQYRNLTPVRPSQQHTPENTHPEAPSSHRSASFIERPTPVSSSVTPVQTQPISSQPSSTYQSPAPMPNHLPTPRPAPSTAGSHGTRKTPSIGAKRDYNSIATSSASPPPARKRPRYAEIPLFARSAREGKPVRYSRIPYTPEALQQDASPLPPPPVLPPSATNATPFATVNGQPTANGISAAIPISQPQSIPPPWEASINDTVPYEDLTWLLCDLIFQHIGVGEPPSGGAKFEIEAKLGEIQSREEHARLRYPVKTETLINTDNVSFQATRFESSMTAVHHKALNDFLNDCLKKSQAPSRIPIHYKHIHEADAFYELTKDGIDNLPFTVSRYITPRHRPRVRITTDLDTKEVTAKIIKSRLVDFDIFSPRTQFDFRISINVESPWNGSEDWLENVDEAGGRRGDRQKDRVSYRHLAYQIDLTQVTYPATNRRDHELEVEVSPDTLRQEIAAAQAGKQSRYEDLVKGFVDNVRLLVRQFPMRS